VRTQAARHSRLVLRRLHRRVGVRRRGALVDPGFKNAYLAETMQRRTGSSGPAARWDLATSILRPASPGPSSASRRCIARPCIHGAGCGEHHRLNARLDAATWFLDKARSKWRASISRRALGVPVRGYLGGAVKDRLTFNA
jgi:hypothetical protein